MGTLGTSSDCVSSQSSQFVVAHVGADLVSARDCRLTPAGGHKVHPYTYLAVGRDLADLRFKPYGDQSPWSSAISPAYRSWTTLRFRLIFGVSMPLSTENSSAISLNLRGCSYFLKSLL